MRSIHLEQVAVALGDLVFAEPLDRVAEVEVHAAPAGTDAAPLVAHFFRGARRDVARREVAEARILPLEVVVALRLGNLRRRLRAIFLPLRHPHAAVVAQRLAHQRELGLMLAAHRNARRVNLREARIRERRAALVRAPDRRGVRALRVRREVEDVAVAARAEHHRVGEVRLDRAGHHVARDDAARAPVDDDQIEHLGRAGYIVTPPFAISFSSA